MGIKTVSNIVLPLDQVCPTDLLARLGVFTREQRQCYPTRPPFPQRPEDLMKKVLPASPPNPFLLSSSLTDK